MKIYVATKFEEADRAREVMTMLRRVGHEITYDWTGDTQFSTEQAVKDFHGVITADALVFIAEKPLAYKGAYVEFGIALGRGIPCYVLGSAADACIFTKLGRVKRGIGELLDRLSTSPS